MINWLMPAFPIASMSQEKTIQFPEKTSPVRGGRPHLAQSCPHGRLLKQLLAKLMDKKLELWTKKELPDK